MKTKKVFFFTVIFFLGLAFSFSGKASAANDCSNKNFGDDCRMNAGNPGRCVKSSSSFFVCSDKPCAAGNPGDSCRASNGDQGTCGTLELSGMTVCLTGKIPSTPDTGSGVASGGVYGSGSGYGSGSVAPLAVGQCAGNDGAFCLVNDSGTFGTCGGPGYCASSANSYSFPSDSASQLPPGSNSVQASPSASQLPSGSVSTTSGAAGIFIPGNAETGLPDPPGGIPQILRSLLTWMLGIVGIVALGSFVISGSQYLTAAGNEGQAETAKKTMTFSILGVVIVLASFVIIQAIQYALEASQSKF